MAGKITTNSVVLGDSITDTQNFVLKTNADCTATLARGALGALGTVFGVNGSGALTGATLVAPALGTPASGVLTNCTGVVAGALPAGSVLQVVNATSTTQTSTSSTSFINVGALSASITPKFSTSKVLILISTSVANTAYVYTTIARNTTELTGGAGLSRSNIPTNYDTPTSLCYLDSPATTSATTYYLQGKVASGTGYFGSSTSTITLMEIAG